MARPGISTGMLASRSTWSPSFSSCTPLSLPASKVIARLPWGVPPTTPGRVPSGRKSLSKKQ